MHIKSGCTNILCTPATPGTCTIHFPATCKMHTWRRLVHSFFLRESAPKEIAPNGVLCTTLQESAGAQSTAPTPENEAPSKYYVPSLERAHKIFLARLISSNSGHARAKGNRILVSGQKFPNRKRCTPTSRCKRNLVQGSRCAESFGGASFFLVHQNRGIRNVHTPPQIIPAKPWPNRCTDL